MNLLVILGPTASGKTHLAVQAARQLNGEILSADSRQVYRGLDIGSGKDLAEYGPTPYHLIDIVDPGCEFSLFDFVQEFKRVYCEVVSRMRLPVLAGGTGLYLDAVLRGYQLVQVGENLSLRQELEQLEDAALVERLCRLRPELHNTTDLTNRERLTRAIEIAEGERRPAAEAIELPDLSPRVFGLRWQRDRLRQRITLRLRQRLDNGMIEEVESLHAAGVAWETLDNFGLEYRFVARYLQGMINRNDLFQQLNSAIHQFAKRQDTWFRRMQRQGVDICWLDAEKDPVEALLAGCQDLVK
ncbi:MAG: tRNA (adenosine(37)-N6)-dimethylallyltransferase MiaA [Desulfuromonadales bacterium]|jgi:tRNA dimethylallyltransferase